MWDILICKIAEVWVFILNEERERGGGAREWDATRNWLGVLGSFAFPLSLSPNLRRIRSENLGSIPPPPPPPPAKPGVVIHPHYCMILIVKNNFRISKRIFVYFQLCIRFYRSPRQDEGRDARDGREGREGKDTREGRADRRSPFRTTRRWARMKRL